MSNILNVLLKTIEEVQQKNANNPKEETADPSIFDLLKKEIGKLDNKMQNKQIQEGRRSPKSIFDMIKDGIEGVRKENRKDPNIRTAPKTVFDELLKKVDRQPQRRASTGLRKIIEDYNLDISGLHPTMLKEIQQKYQSDVQNLNQQYASGLHRLINQHRRR